MIHTPAHISRRHALKGIGSLISLPLSEAMIPAGARAAEVAKPPVRLVWLFAGSGMFMPAYKPSLAGKNWHESKEIADGTLTPLHVIMGMIVARDGTIYATTIYPYSLLKVESVKAKN
jgi:hypothetical protein